MIEKPGIPDWQISACLASAFGIIPTSISFLPIGADLNTAVYRVVDREGDPYFLKIRMGDFNEIAVALPKLLSAQRIPQIIAPLATKSGQLWADLDNYKITLYPFIESRNGYEVDLTAEQWEIFGAALKRIHTASIPAKLRDCIPRENFSANGRETVKVYLKQAQSKIVTEPLAARLAAFLRERHTEICDMVRLAERLAAELQTQIPELILCHSDLHAGNILIDTNNKLYIVDWNNPILAPKEHDLMYPGGAQGFTGHKFDEEVDFFFRGYGQTTINPTALAYYRFERIIQDIAIYCEQLFRATGNREDREQALIYLASNFLSNGTIEAAYRAASIL